MGFQNGDKIILIGDSITDSGRFDDAEGLGFGYVRLIADFIKLNHYNSELEIVNKGISGDRVIDLEARWENDVIQEQPDWVSISIGINDVWRQIDDNPGRPVYIDEYTAVYRKLVKDTKEKTNAKLILLETTVIEEDLDSKGNELLEPYNKAIREIAEENNALLVPMNQGFHDYIKQKNAAILTTDGVHMNSTGNLLMATIWLRKCGLL